VVRVLAGRQVVLVLAFEGDEHMADKPKGVEHYRETFYEFSGKVSDVARQLAFAAIAVIWLFKKDTPQGQLSIPHDLIFPGFLVLAALAADFLQYVVAAVTWHVYYIYLERKGITESVDHSSKLVGPITVLFYIKVVAVIWAYVLILWFLLKTFGLM
jgi:hypothetical protein